MSGVRPGDVIAGKYRVERLLGEGGMGYVVAATHLQLGQMVALKFMREEVCTADYRSRFLREARNTVRLTSKHVSRILDVGTLESGLPYMVMEYLEGTDLSALFHARGPLPVHEVCEYILQACEAIAEAHASGIVHRDLKPANLFLTRGPGGEPVVKVLDFGVSKVLDLGMNDDTNPGGRPAHARDRGRGRERERPDSVVTKATDLLGSPSYMAPEQIVSATNADERSDIWSLGVMLFRLISGSAPFHATTIGELIQAVVHGPIPSLRDVKPDLPQGLEYVVGACMQRDRAHRLGDAAELARMLAPYAGPVAMPSLERIAILGPALVTAPSFPGPSSLQPRSWTQPSLSPAAPPPAGTQLTPKRAAIAGALFVVTVALTAIAVAHFLSRSRGEARTPVAMSTATTWTTTDAMPVVVVPPVAVVPPAAVVTSAAPTVGPAPPEPPAVASAPSAAPQGGRGRSRVRPRGNTRGTSIGDIPPTRE